jgi:hypothetical protein
MRPTAPESSENVDLLPDDRGRLEYTVDVAAKNQFTKNSKQKFAKLGAVFGTILALGMATGRAQSDSDNVITRRNAPLGIELSAVQKRFPSCTLDKNPGGRQSPRDKAIFEPLTGYSPPFPDLTPSDADGTILTLAWRESDGSSETMAVLDWGAVTEADLRCPGGDLGLKYELLVFNGKVMGVAKNDVDKNFTEAATLLGTLAAVVPGRRGPVHRSFYPESSTMSNDGSRHSVPVYVTYVDDNNLRVVMETIEPHQTSFGRSWTAINVAYIDLSLWKMYTARVQDDIARVGIDALKDRQEHERKLQNKM